MIASSQRFRSSTAAPSDPRLRSRDIESIEVRPLPANSRLSKWVRPSGSRQQISPSKTAECAQTACAISSASCGHCFEPVAVAGHELAAAPPHDRQRPEAVQLRLEEEVGMIERLRDPEEPHGVDGTHWAKQITDERRAQRKRLSPALPPTANRSVSSVSARLEVVLRFEDRRCSRRGASHSPPWRRQQPRLRRRLRPPALPPHRGQSWLRTSG